MTSHRFVRPFSPETYRQRRLKLGQQLQKESDGDFVAVLWSGSELVRNNSSHFPFRATSDFLYLSGFSEPETLIVISSVKGKISTAMGLRPRDLSTQRGSEIWEGERLGVERAEKHLLVDEAFDCHKMEEFLHRKLGQARSLFWVWGQFPDLDSRITRMISRINHAQRGLPNLTHVQDYRPVLHEMRRKKSSEEIELMRRSATIAAHGHLRAMATTRPGHYEYQIQAEVEREFKRLGAQHTAYNSIVASGNNACTLHYISNNCLVKKTDLILIDAGAELDGYASDITRTYPVSGTFSAVQRAVYEIVLEAQLAAIATAKVGAEITKPHQAASRVIAAGLKTLGFFKRESVATILKKNLWRPYFPHGTSHWLGLDVHDAGGYKNPARPHQDMVLSEGSVITVEPGLYFREDDKTVPARYRGIGIRIEDDVHITRKGPDVLSAACPKSIADIEAACGPKL
jgi:Xaa-Pro aminopeptidase